MKVRFLPALAVFAWFALLMPIEAPAGGKKKKRGGAEITSVQKGGPADRAGLRRGDWIVEINGNDCRNSNDVRRLLPRNGTADITAFRVNPGRYYEFRVKVQNGSIGAAYRSGFVLVPD